MLASLISLQQYLYTLSPAELAAAKSELINIFRANPWLSRFYAGFFDLCDSNPLLFNNLQTRSGNFFNPDLAHANPEGSTSMAINKAARLCTHIKVNGIPCRSPALRGELFCYFHQRLIRGVPTPPKSRLHPMAFLEDAESIQASLMETINALVRNTIDFRRAQLILRALHIAAKNAPRAHFNFSQHAMVNEVPQYPPAPAPKPLDAALEQAGVLTYVGRPSLPKWATIAARTPDIAASADPTRPKRPGRVASAPIAKVPTTYRRPLGDQAGHPEETRLRDHHLDSMLRYNLGYETNATKTK
jgi:hypothetical protein